MTSTIFTGWREQYDRMMRSHQRLLDHAAGKVRADPDKSRDTLVHFFQEALHLRDWICNDHDVPEAVRTEAPAAIKGIRS